MLVENLVERVKRDWSRSPKLGIVLGTGAGQIADALEVERTWEYADLPGYARSTAIGHRGRLVAGRLDAIAVLAMQGRFHGYEGHASQTIGLPIQLFAAMGIRDLLITNAAGGVNPDFQCGELMAINGLLDLNWRTAAAVNAMLIGRLGERQTAPVEARSAIRADWALDAKWLDLASTVARTGGFALYRGVYAGLMGPNYETRAEYRMVRKLGADAVGMSTLGEVCMASALGLRALAISVISNVAQPDALLATSGQEVVDSAAVAAPRLLAIARRMAAQLGDNGLSS